jgi:hypothetical protein
MNSKLLQVLTLHAVENLTRNLDGRDNSRKAFIEEYNVGSTASGIRGTLNGNTTVGTLERRCVVDLNNP